MTKQRIYRIVFHNQGKVYEIYARSVGQGNLFGFVEVADLVFGEKSSLVVDPSEERLKGEFAGVDRFHVPMHAVVRIDELERKEGAAKIMDADGKVTPFPTFIPGGPGKS